MKNNQFVIGLVTVSLSLILHVCYCTFYLSYLSPSIIVIIIAFIAGIIFLIVSKKNFCKEEESLRLKLGMALFLKREKEEEIHNFFRCIQYEYEKETGTTLLLDNIASITYLKADVIQCHFNDSVIIANICNDGGNWDNDFALSLSKRWEQPEQEYRQ